MGFLRNLSRKTQNFKCKFANSVAGVMLTCLHNQSGLTCWMFVFQSAWAASSLSPPRLLWIWIFKTLEVSGWDGEAAKGAGGEEHAWSSWETGERDGRCLPWASGQHAAAGWVPKLLKQKQKATALLCIENETISASILFSAYVIIRIIIVFVFLQNCWGGRKSCGAWRNCTTKKCKRERKCSSGMRMIRVFFLEWFCNHMEIYCPSRVMLN